MSSNPNWLTPQEELVLVQRYQETKDQGVLTRLVDSQYGYIRKLSYKCFKAFRGDVVFEDLVQTAVVGFVNGVLHYNLEFKTRLMTYAHFWIMNELFITYQNSLAMHIPAHRLREMCWRGDNQRAEELNRMYERVARPAQLQRIYDEQSSDDVIMKQLEFSMASDSTVEAVQKEYLSLPIQKALNSLPEKMQRAIWMRAGLDGDGVKYSLAEIAEELGCSYDEAELYLRQARQALRKSKAFQDLRKAA